MIPKKNLIIIGAGLSGLYTATLLQDRFNIIILEARDRLGGRILTLDGHDLGPSWVWPHQKNILNLLHEEGLELFTQYTHGEALYDVPQGVQRFNSPPSSPSSRVKGGLDKLISSLASKLAPDTIILNEKVTAISSEDSLVCVETSKNSYTSDYVVSTLAPRLACENIMYVPPLDDAIKQTMLNTPTWMGHTAKCVIEFKEAFWKQDGLSGFVFSHIGPLGEIHDASTDDKPALFGFLQHLASTDNIEKDVREQMKRLFESKSEFITKIYFTDWRQEEFSSTHHDHKGLSSHPEYGLNLQHFDNKLFFIGTETAYDNGGYLEGAVVSAQEVAKKLI